MSLGADGGIQGEEYEFGRGSNYATVSLLLNWTFFDGGARRAAVRQANAVARRTADAVEELTQQVQLEVQQSLDRLNTSADSLATADARAEAARAAFRIASRKRDEGVISQVEFIDARSSLTGAELNLNVTRFEVLARQAELDYATAAGTLPLECLPMNRIKTTGSFTGALIVAVAYWPRCSPAAASSEAPEAAQPDAGAHPARQPGARGSAHRHQRHRGQQSTRCACRSRWAASCAASTCRKATWSSGRSASPRSS